MHRWFSFLIFFALCAVNPIFAQDAVQAFRGYQPYSKYISFTYDARIADGVRDRLNPYNAPPQFTEIVLQDFVEGMGWLDRDEYVRVYPIAEFQPGLYMQNLQLLTSLIDNTPAAPPQLPALPWQEAPQNIQNLAFLDFQTGSGVRYTGNFSSLGDLYSFQGLTTDGVYYISAWFKLTDPAQIAMYDALFASLTVTSPQATFTLEGEVINVDYDEIGFTVDSALGRRIEVSKFEAIIADPQENLVGSTPDYIEFLVFGYPVGSVAQFPRLLVQHVETFAPNSPSAEVLERLQAVIAAREPLQPRNFSAPGTQQPLPLLPLIPAPQTYILHPAWLDFDGGTGYRFIVYHSQDIEQIMNFQLFYVFQGMTDDGTHAVAAFFPIHTSVLSITYDPGISMMGTGMYDGYLQETFEALQADTDITPPLAALDAIIESLNIE